MRTSDLHSALKTTVVAEVTEAGIHYKQVRLQHGKDDFLETLHARPSSYSTAGIQATDFLHFVGFSRSVCSFHLDECYCRTLSPGQDVTGLAKAVGTAFEKFKGGARALENCGLFIDQPEGWGFFHGKAGSGRTFHVARPYGDGHVAPKSERMKESQDTFFRFVFTWIDGSGDKGWTTHYRAKHMPLSPEFQAALDFIGGFSWFQECPEFDFEGCWWRFTPFRADEQDVFNRNTEYAHTYFDSHATHFSQGLAQLLGAHAELEPHGISFLSIQESDGLRPIPVSRPSIRHHEETPARSVLPQRFDVALSYAGTERQHAEELAKRVRGAGFEVFYDGFYPEQLWGKDLASFFDRVYRKDSRFCVMFVSHEYAERMWTTHERRSAQARAVQEKGREYILPVRVDNTDLDGLPPTVGYLSLKEYTVEQIADLLVKKLRGVT